MKRCKKCNKVQELDNFYTYRDVFRRVGVRGTCKRCYAKQNNQNYELNQEKIKVRARDRILFVNFGLTRTQYNLLVLGQGGACAICGFIPNSKQRSLAVDHDHKTGKVRGLLCQFCNRGLGLFKDSTHLLTEAKRYLDTPRCG